MRFFPPGCRAPGFQRSLLRNAVQPVAHQVFLKNGPGLAQKDQKRGLESVLGILMVLQKSSADAPNHGPMTLHQGFERSLIAVAKEIVEQFAVGHAKLRSQNCFAQTVKHSLHARHRHSLSPVLSGPPGRSSRILEDYYRDA